MITALRRHALTAGVAAIALLFLATRRVTWHAASASIDARLLLVLFALLVAVELLRLSGWLDLAVVDSVSCFHSTRPFALALIILSMKPLASHRLFASAPPARAIPAPYMSSNL